MKTIANLLLAISVAIGVLAASSAYLAPLALPDEDLLGLTLSADVGRVVDPTSTPIPVARRGEQITETNLAAIRANEWTEHGRTVKPTYLPVKEFAFERWQGRWMFLLSLAGLLVGGLMMRSASKKELAAADAAAADAPHEESPEGAIAAVLQTLDDLRRDMSDIADKRARCQMVLQRVGELQTTHLPAFVEAKPRLIARMGLGAYAEMMGQFSQGERLLNRAWSSAADAQIHEAAACLEEARPPLEATAKTLAR